MLSNFSASPNAQMVKFNSLILQIFTCKAIVRKPEMKMLRYH